MKQKIKSMVKRKEFQKEASKDRKVELFDRIWKRKIYRSSSDDFRFSYSSGQMLILSAIFIITGLILIFNIIGAPFITEEKRFQEGRVLDKTAKNLLNEYRHAVGIATLRPKPNESASILLSNLSSYLRGEIDAEILYASVFVNGTNQLYSVNVGNFLDAPINITVDVTNSAPSSLNAAVNDRSNSTFNFASSINGTVSVTLSYAKGNANVVEKFPINVSTKNFMKGFFDVTLKDGNSFIRVKEEYNRTW